MLVNTWQLIACSTGIYAIIYIFAHQIEKSDVLPWVRNLLSYPSDLTKGPRLVT